MTDNRKPGSFLLPLIAKIRAERIGDDVEQLWDAELLRSMAQVFELDTTTNFP